MPKTDTAKPVDPRGHLLCSRHRDLIERRAGADQVRRITRQIAERLTALKPDILIEAKKTSKKLSQICCKLGEAGVSDILLGKPIKFPAPKPEKNSDND